MGKILLTLLSFGALLQAQSISAGNAVIPRTLTDSRTNFSILDRNNSPIKGPGNLTQWQVYSATGNTNPIQLLVHRSTGLNTYAVIGSSAEVTPVGGLNTFTLTPAIPVQAGDVLGLYFRLAGSVVSDLFGTDDRMDLLGPVLFTNAASGISAAFANSSDRIYSVAATGITTADAYQVRYAANLAIGDSVINFTNTGGSSTDSGIATGGAQNGDICANVYAYSPDEQLVSCCSCNVTPNALNSLSVKNDLASNTLTPIIPSALVVKVVVTRGGAACTASSAAVATRTNFAPGLRAWGTTIHALPETAGTPSTTYGVTETPFAVPSTLSDAELNRMTQLCAFIRAYG